jgi:hypothetical protein
MQRPSNNYYKDEKGNEQNHPLEQMFPCELKFGSTTFIHTLTSVVLVVQTASLRLSLGTGFRPG